MKKTKRPPQAKVHVYRGKITLSQAVAGISAALRNAKRLRDDAITLFNVGSYATALSLAVLAIEECGKYGVIHRILIAKSDKQRKEHWQEYTTHTAKNVSWVVSNLVQAGASHIDDFNILGDETSIHPFVLDDLKQWGLYTDCRGMFWSDPAKIISRQMAFEVIRQAKDQVRNTHEVTEDQLAAYLKHLSQVWTEDPRDADQSKVKKALEDYMIECQQRGWLRLDIDVHGFFHGDKSKGA
jgi:AbiV family abortive infection protein